MADQPDRFPLESLAAEAFFLDVTIVRLIELHMCLLAIFGVPREHECTSGRVGFHAYEHLVHGL